MTDKTTGALTTQVGGSHYKDCKIQPIEYIHANDLPFIEGSVVKYITRWRNKGGIKDLEKIKHFVDLLIELEGKAAPAEDLWFPWSGGECPVPPETVVEIQRRDGVKLTREAVSLSWARPLQFADTEVVAYRIVKSTK